MFDKYSRKSDENGNKVIEMIESNEYLKFENLNKLSKHIYLYWLNENKKHDSLVGRKNCQFYTLEECCFYRPIFDMLKRNSHLVYKPLRNYLQ